MRVGVSGQNPSEAFASPLSAMCWFGLTDARAVQIRSMTLLSIVMDPVTAGGLLAPLFIAMDLFALRYWKSSTWSKPDLVLLLPGLVIGIGFGYLLFRFLDHRAIARCARGRQGQVAQRWPSATLDRRSAQRPSKKQVGTRRCRSPAEQGDGHNEKP
jgi:hypothetical protein